MWKWTELMCLRSSEEFPLPQMTRSSARQRQMLTAGENNSDCIQESDRRMCQYVTENASGMRALLSRLIIHEGSFLRTPVKVLKSFLTKTKVYEKGGCLISRPIC